jgi:hypothetical protein
MKKRKWFLFFVSLIFAIACGIGMPFVQNVRIYPKSPEILYGKLIVTLQELGYKITHTDASSGVVLAEKLIETGMTGAGRVVGDMEHPYQISIYISKDLETGGGKVSISVSCPGAHMFDFMKADTPQKLTDEILAKLKEKL